LTPCSDHGRHDCTLEAACLMRPHWPAVDAALRGVLAGIPLTQLSRPAAPLTIASTAPVAEVLA
ncbi:MAG: AsnC family transcriptional regulator, partial [Novosphingobium sp. 35-62-5]